jgi:hypothetical protein
MAGGKNRELKSLLLEASQALARLDARRLEEIALLCTALIREDSQCGLSALNSPEIRKELTVFGCVVEATKANLGVLRSLRDRENLDLDYSLPALRSTSEVAHGDH